MTRCTSTSGRRRRSARTCTGLSRLRRAMPIEFAERIRRIPVYPAAEGYALAGDVALLASNESPYPPIPAVVDAISRALSGLNRYPDPTSSALRAALSDRYGVPVHRIAIGNGSCDILLAAGEALLEPGSEIVYAWPSFSVYPHMAAATGARAIRVPLNDQHAHDLDAMLAEITVATRLVVVCNPNNPTSTALPLAEIARFVEAVPRNVCVLIDEAYCEFNVLDDPDASLDLVRRHSNVVLLRTFSKVYGLAGLRCGYALCGDERFRVAVEQVRQPFFCNALAQAAAEEALLHQDEITKRVEQTIAERLGLEEELRAMGLQVADAQANFLWHSLGTNGDVDAEREHEIVDGLAARKVLIRTGSALGRDGWARTTIGTPAENRRFLDALRELI